METKATALDLVAQALAWFVIFLTPMFPVMNALLILVVCDFISGIWAAKKKGERIQSNAMYRTVSKIVMYFIAIVAGLSCEVAVPGVPFTKVATGFIAVVELKSIYENVGYITGVDVWSAVREFLNNRKKQILEEKENDKS